MTFPELVLSSRGRLWDIRARDGSLITDATKDGIRYPASEMLSICKGAILEMLRTFRALKLRELVDEATVYRRKAITIEKDTGLIADFDSIATTNIIALRGSNPKHIYEWQDPEKFYARYYDTQTFSGSAEIEGRFYSIIWDESNKKKLILTLPIETKDITGEAIYRFPYTDIMELTSIEQLPLYDVDDLLWDYIEREARRREHSPAMVKELTETINNKLAELKVGIQRTS